MGNILVTGIPSVGKRELSDLAVEDSRRVYGARVSLFSQSDLMLATARRLWNTESISRLDYSLQQLLREHAVLELSHLLKSSGANSLVNVPLTVRTHGVPNVNCSMSNVQKLSDAAPFDYVVTVIDDPNEVAKRRDGRESVDEILDWMAYEVDIARAYADAIEANHLTIPYQNSERTLTVLLNDENPPICYLAGPITSLKERDGDSPDVRDGKKFAREEMRVFRELLKNYCIVVAPMELADTGTTRKEVDNTVFRDLHWFVRQADFTLAHFPIDCPSTGTFEEMRQTSRIGKPSVLIHPADKKEVFGFKPTFHYHNGLEFLEAVRQSEDGLLSRLYVKGSPRYDRFNIR